MRSGATENEVSPSTESPISEPKFQLVGAIGRMVVDAELAEADPARQALEEAVALGELPQCRRGARGEQAKVAGVLRDRLA
jgi:hypothetical protein